MYGAVGVLAVMCSMAERGPCAVGLKVNVIVHSAPGVSVLQVDDSANSDGLVPATSASSIFIDALPTFCNVMVCGGLVWPTRTPPNPIALVLM
jgi:hypothetical protein